jgi:fructose-1,6-bisphosphatase II
VAPPAPREVIDITDRPEARLAHVAAALGKEIAESRVVVFDKPRHVELIERLRRAGASVTAPPDGDVAGALEALLPSGEADLLMGVGGTAGLDEDRFDGLQDLVDGPAFFVTTGVTGGSLLARPRAPDGAVVTESLVIAERGVRLVRGRPIPQRREVG